MTKFIMVALLIPFPALAQDIPSPSKARPTDREQIQADRARVLAEEKNAPTARPWDRDPDGKRPWERKTPSK
jgi:hypothetical protein